MFANSSSSSYFLLAIEERMPLVCVDIFFALDLPFLLFDWLDVFSISSSPALEQPHELTPIVFISKNLLIKIKQ